MKLEELIEHHRTIRVIGFDDAPFERQSGQPVAVAGIVCAGTRFEGMVWGQIQPDGWDATDRLCQLLLNGKFLPQIHVVLLDGISMGGFNVIDLPELAARLNRPCVAVMRRLPRLSRIEYAVNRLSGAAEKLAAMQRAGAIHAYPPFYFQVCGAEPATIAKVLHLVTDRGHVPEALRLAHLIAAAVIKGESGRQA